MRATRFDVTAAVVPLADFGRVHVLAVGGAGMSAVARLLLAAGLPVSGSDARDSELLRALGRQGVRVSVGHDAAAVAGVDTIVVSSAIREDNVELVAARAAGARVLHRSAALAALAAGRRAIAVAGANGKTTTTSMLATALLEAGEDPSYAIGGELATHGTNAHLGQGEAFVIEADESDGSFLAYRPNMAIVTNVQPDHLDFYGSFDAVQQAYSEFVDSIGTASVSMSGTGEGLLIACADDPGSSTLAAQARGRGRRVLTYGTHPEADLRLCDVRGEGMTAVATLAGPAAADTGEPADLVVHLPGEHNVLNAAAAYLAAVHGLGLPPAVVLAGLAAYTGTRRRFERRGVAGGVTVIDDYAHNPGKVAAVVSTARRFAGAARLVVAFQPHLYSRTRDFATQFGRGLTPADVVMILDVYAAREDPIPGVSGRLVADALRAARPDAVVVYEPDRAAAAGTLASLVQPGDVVLTVGAGDITEVGPSVLDLLHTRPPGSDTGE